MLILGSFPSAASLAARQYYAHPRNQFWRILEAVCDYPLNELNYAEKIDRVKAAGIAIWDEYASCLRAGSLDTAIHDSAASDLASLRHAAPSLRRICFNGRMAARRLRDVEVLGFEPFVLPSTSPANAGMSFSAKLTLWRAALSF